MLVVACRVLYPLVTQSSTNRVSAAVIGSVVAAPFTAELFAFAWVNEFWSGLDTTHDCMPEVIHPIDAVAPLLTR